MPQMTLCAHDVDPTSHLNSNKKIRYIPIACQSTYFVSDPDINYVLIRNMFACSVHQVVSYMYVILYLHMYIAVYITLYPPKQWHNKINLS